jgi:hypothetical protein
LLCSFPLAVAMMQRPLRLREEAAAVSLGLVGPQALLVPEASLARAAQPERAGLPVKAASLVRAGLPVKAVLLV